MRLYASSGFPRSRRLKETSGSAPVSSGGAEQPIGPVSAVRRPSLEEQARQRGTLPIESDYSCAAEWIFESDDEVEEFIAFTYAGAGAELDEDVDVARYGVERVADDRTEHVQAMDADMRHGNAIS